MCLSYIQMYVKYLLQNLLYIQYNIIYLTSRIYNMQKSPRSPASQGSQQEQPQPQSNQQSQTQNHPIYDQSTGQALGAMRQQDLYVSPYWVLGCFSFLGILFVLFIYFLVVMMARMQGPPTAQNSTDLLRMRMVRDKIVKNIANNSKVEQNNVKGIDVSVFDTELDQFIKQQNTQHLPTDIFFAKYLYTHSSSNITQNKLSKYQQQYYNKLYGDYHIKQGQTYNSFCIIISQQANINTNKIQNLLQSIERINYKNYKIIYINKQNNKQIINILKQYNNSKSNENISNKIYIAEQSQQYKYNQCGLYDIIVKIKIQNNFIFINKEIFNILNYLYQKDNNVWLIYTNGLVYNQNISSININNKDNNKNTKKYSKSKERGLADYQYSQIRNLKNFDIDIPFITFKKQLLTKIDIQQLNHISKQQNSQKQKHILYSLIQLSGQNHTKYENIIPYFVEKQNKAIKQKRINENINVNKQMLLQYLPIQSLDDIVKRAPFKKISN